MLAAGLLAVCSGDAQDMKRYRETTITPMAGMTLATVTGDDTDDCTWKMGFRSMSMKNRNPIIHNGYFSFVLGYRF